MSININGNTSFISNKGLGNGGKLDFGISRLDAGSAVTLGNLAPRFPGATWRLVAPRFVDVVSTSEHHQYHSQGAAQAVILHMFDPRGRGIRHEPIDLRVILVERFAMKPSKVFMIIPRDTWWCGGLMYAEHYESFCCLHGKH